MANIKAAKKKIKVIKKKTAINKGVKTGIKSAEKKVFAAIDAANYEEALAAFKSFEKKAMRAADRNILHKNNAARRISRLEKRVEALK